MSKIRNLTQEEAVLLRLRVRQRFLRNSATGNGFRPNSFKGAYENLRDDISRKVQGAASSVSLTRLRKLYYYTDPAVCPVEKLEKPSFGRDFIDALEQYVKDEPIPAPAAPPAGNKWITRKLGLSSIILVIITGLVFQLLKPKNPKNWREDFTVTLADSLHARGFEWLDFDAEWWSRQSKDSFLTLYTHPGDYWVKPGEERVIKNMLYKKISGNCFTITVKIDHFNPSQNGQHFDVFLFDERLSRETHLRAGMSYWQTSADDPGVQYTTTDYQEMGNVTQLGYFHVRNPADKGQKINTLWLKIKYKNNEISVYQKLNYEWNLWGQCTQPSKLNIQPAFIGLAAFQGWTNDDGSPRAAPPIPVVIDFLEVEYCDD